MALARRPRGSAPGRACGVRGQACVPGPGAVRSTISVDVAAPPSLVFRLARDIERWPRLLPHYVRVRQLERDGEGRLTAEMGARRPLAPVLGLGLPVAWRSRTWSVPEALRLRFVHL